VPEKEALSLLAVIAKIKNIADSEFENKVYDNILTIFNRLNTREKKILLKGLINICFIIDNKVLVNSNDLLDVKAAVKCAEDIIVSSNNSVEEYNKVELIKLKSWLVKTTTLALLIGILVTIIITAKASASDGTASSLVDNLLAVMKVIFSN
jgi:hypothetical protein